MVATKKWEEFEKAAFLPFIRKHERKQTSWKERVSLWEKKFGYRSMGSLRGHLSRCILEGSYPKDETAGSRSPPTDVKGRAKPAKRLQKAVLCRPERSPRAEEARSERQSVWSVPSSPEPSSPEPSAVPVIEDSPTPPPRSSKTPTSDTSEENLNVPSIDEEVARRLKYCLVFCKC